jgi:DNA-binding CsgD family transcriptional regulator
MHCLTTPTGPAALPMGEADVSHRQAEPGRANAMARMLDVVDYGMLLVVDDGCVLFANQVARAEMDDEHPLQLLGSDLRARCPRDVVSLHTALSGALVRGMQALLALGGAPGQAMHIAVVPLAYAGEAAAAVIFGKRRVCEDLSSDAFARQHGLTLAESRVLKHLCTGERPQDIAAALGVKLSTVRTQIGSIRAKTGSRDIGAIVHRVARLPPLPSVRHVSRGAQAASFALSASSAPAAVW